MFEGTFPQSLPWLDQFSKKVNQIPQFLVTTDPYPLNIKCDWIYLHKAAQLGLVSSSDTSFKARLHFEIFHQAALLLLVPKLWCANAQCSFHRWLRCQTKGHTLITMLICGFYHHFAMYCICSGNAKTPRSMGWCHYLYYDNLIEICVVIFVAVLPLQQETTGKVKHLIKNRQTYCSHDSKNRLLCFKMMKNKNSLYLLWVILDFQQAMLASVGYSNLSCKFCTTRHNWSINWSEICIITKSSYPVLKEGFCINILL